VLADGVLVVVPVVGAGDVIGAGAGAGAETAGAGAGAETVGAGAGVVLPVLLVDTVLPETTSNASITTQSPWELALLRPVGPKPTVCGPEVSPETV
jgi:hypothetical protein